MSELTRGYVVKKIFQKSFSFSSRIVYIFNQTGCMYILAINRDTIKNRNLVNL